MNEVGKRLRAARGYRSAETVARAVGVRAMSVYRWEYGLCLPRLETQHRLAEYFGTTMEYLFEQGQGDTRDGKG